MRSISKLAGFASFLILFSSCAFAATVTGTVKGPDGAPFEGAFVQAVNAKTKISVSVLSDKQGRYRVENLPAGEYQVRVRAVGFTTEPHSAVSLTADQNISFEFALKQGTVRWSDLNLYQGKQLMPDGKGKDVLSTNCFICHGFQTRMAAVRRDEDGWRDRVNYMRDAMAFQLSERFNDQKANDVISYLNTVFGEDSTVPRSPTELSGVQGNRPAVQRRGYEYRLRRIRRIRLQGPALERLAGQGRKFLDPVLRERKRSRQTQSQDGRTHSIPFAF